MPQQTTTTTPQTSSPDEAPHTKIGRPRKPRSQKPSTFTLNKVKADAVLDWIRPRLLLVHNRNPEINTRKEFYRAFIKEFRATDLPLSTFTSLARKAGVTFTTRICIAPPPHPAGTPTVLNALAGEPVPTPPAVTRDLEITTSNEDDPFDNETGRPNALTTR